MSSPNTWHPREAGCSQATELTEPNMVILTLTLPEFSLTTNLHLPTETTLVIRVISRRLSRAAVLAWLSTKRFTTATHRGSSLGPKRSSRGQWI